MSLPNSFDVLVLGAGAAGCAAARALALSDPHAVIGLMERGPPSPPPFALRVPLLSPLAPRLPTARPFLRRYRCANRPWRPILRGAGLGGSTIFGDARYLRGTAADYDAWPDAAWSFARLLPYFTRLERNTRGASAFHGADGPIAVSDADAASVRSELNLRWLDACEALGVPWTADCNDGTADGFAAFQSHTHRGERVGFFDALLSPDRRRTPNVHLLTRTAARRLVFGAAHPRLCGVETAERVIPAARVVVCLGALESPALLWRSGVCAGGAVADAPHVGRNLIAPSAATLCFAARPAWPLHSTSLCASNAAHLWREWREYAAGRGGSFASLAEVGAFVRSRPALAAADLSLAFYATPHFVPSGASRPMNGFAVRVTHHYPSARGHVGVDAEGDALVHTALLRPEADVAAMEEGTRWVGSLCGAAPFAALRGQLHHPAAGLSTREATEAFLARDAEAAGDFFGTCAMGTVVDAKLRLRGVEGVMVADCSVVPAPTCGTGSVIGAVIGSRVAEMMQKETDKHIP